MPERWPKVYCCPGEFWCCIKDLGDPRLLPMVLGVVVCSCLAGVAGCAPNMSNEKAGLGCVTWLVLPGPVVADCKELANPCADSVALLAAAEDF